MASLGAAQPAPPPPLPANITREQIQQTYIVRRIIFVSLFGPGVHHAWRILTPVQYHITSVPPTAQWIC